MQHRLRLLLLSVLLPLGALFCLTLNAAGPADKLARLPQPWTEPIHRISFEEYDATLKYWAAQHPGLFTLQKRGESHDGQPVYLVKITDASVPDEDKQVALVSALHGGPERSGTTTILHLIEWLMGDSELAKETRRKQIVLFVPIANPHAFFTTDRFTNKERIDLYDSQIAYWDLPKLKLAVPKRTPELAAFLGIVDEYQPEMHLDLHGTGLQAFPEEKLGDRTMLKGQTMFEVSACSYSNCGVRPWDPRVTEAMVKAGIEAGFGSDRAEADAQRCFYNPDHDVFSSRLWIAPRPERFRTMFYLPGVNATAIEKFFSLGPEHRVTANNRITDKGEAIQHGIGFRLRLPYRSPALLDVAVNGHTLTESATDGYQVWYADGFTQLQINVPPAKAKLADLFVVTCAYDGNEPRTYGWKPPEAVTRQLQKK